MEISEIINDAIRYPINNVKAVVIYLILSVILGAVLGGTVGTVFTSSVVNNVIAAFGLSIIGIIITILLGFLINGYELDIIRYGITKDSDAPEIDFVRQFLDGVKLFIVKIVYFIIPIIISAFCAVIFRDWIAFLLLAIIFILFGLAELMGECRLAKTDDLMYALSIGDAIADISRVGFFKIVAIVIILAIMGAVIFLIGGLISQLNSIIGGIILTILGVYLTFVMGRACGLLYSEV